MTWWTWRRDRPGRCDRPFLRWENFVHHPPVRILLSADLKCFASAPSWGRPLQSPPPTSPHCSRVPGTGLLADNTMAWETTCIHRLDVNPSQDYPGWPEALILEYKSALLRSEHWLVSQISINHLSAGLQK